MSAPRPAPLAGLKVVEISAFIAAPLGAMTLAQLGADVIRIDPLGGNIDANRWPVSADGTSIYWASLNKGKRSVTLDLKSDEGQKIATDLIAEAGTLVTNLPARGWLSYENLVQHREDLVMLRLNGSHDGKPAVDYTINAASGFPIITGDDEWYHANLRNYGSIFVGEWSTVAYSDKGMAGTNHTLPTAGGAKHSAGLSVSRYLKPLTYQRVEREATPAVAPATITISASEGMSAHEVTAQMRLDRFNGKG